MITSNSSSPTTHWAVVGGGMMGLAAALKLLERGQRVTLLEAAPELGGLASAWQLGDVEWDKFYHVILLSDSRLRSLLNDLKLDQEIEWVQTKTGFYSDNRLYSLSSSLDFICFPPLNLYQKFRLGSTIFCGSKIRDWQAMESLTVESWLRRWSGHSTFEKIWLPLLKSKLGEAYRRTSAAFIWSYIDRMYKARRSGMKREMFGYVPGGYRRILQTILHRLQSMGATVITGAPVRQVVNSITQPGSFEVTYDQADRSAVACFDRVVMTTPLAAVAEACKQLRDDERQRMRATEYLGVVCTSLLLQEPLGGYYVTNILDRWVPLTGIIEMGSIVNPSRLGGHYLVYLPQYLMSDDPALEEASETIHERCLSTLEKMYPGFDRQSVKAIQTARAKYVMALPTLHYSQRRPPVILSQPGLYLLNSARIVKGNLNVNETLELLEEEFNRDVWPHHQKMLPSTVENAFAR
jgi:protoporphyrinogen oxidase